MEVRRYLVTLVSYPGGDEIREIVPVKAYSARDAADQLRIEKPSYAIVRVEPDDRDN